MGNGKGRERIKEGRGRRIKEEEGLRKEVGQGGESRGEDQGGRRVKEAGSGGKERGQDERGLRREQDRGRMRVKEDRWRRREE